MLYFGIKYIPSEFRIYFEEYNRKIKQLFKDLNDVKMPKFKKHLKNENQEIARERVKILFEQARLRFKKSPELSDRYMQLARRMAMKFRVRFTSAQKRQFCKKCYSFLAPGVNCRVRVYRGMIRYNCLKCKNVARIKISK